MKRLRIIDKEGDTLMIKQDGKGAIISCANGKGSTAVYITNEDIQELIYFLKQNNQCK